MEKLIFVLLACSIVVQVRGPHHHEPDHHEPQPDPNHDHNNDCHGPDCDLVDRVIHDIGGHVDDHECHVFKDISCEFHKLVNDEQICASDDVTYENHCLFVKARCIRILEHHHEPLTIKKHGPCVDPTTTTVTTGSEGKSSVAPVTTLAPASATSALLTTTIQPLNSVIGSVFCQYKSVIDCSATLAVVCGSNGNFYPNMCELMKVQCGDQTLKHETDPTICSASP